MFDWVLNTPVLLKRCTKSNGQNVEQAEPSFITSNLIVYMVKYLSNGTVNHDQISNFFCSFLQMLSATSTNWVVNHLALMSAATVVRI